jgi:hypothetical protein
MDTAFNHEPGLEKPDSCIPTDAPTIPCDSVPVAPRTEFGVEFVTEDTIVLNLIKEIPDLLLLDVKSNCHARCQLSGVSKLVCEVVRFAIHYKPLQGQEGPSANVVGI